MTKISIYLYDNCISHFCTHLAAKIEDEKTQAKLIIEFGYGDNLESLCYPGEHSDSVKLTSDKSFDEFLKLYNKEFKDENYGFFYKNCADAVNFALNHFFPKAYAAQCWFTTKKVVWCLPGIAFLGARCVPAPLLITTPNSVFSKAKSIASSNSMEEVRLLSSDPAAPEKMSMR